MPQLSLYLDKPLYMELKTKAKEKEVSISNFVSEALRERIDNDYPEGFFDLFGCLADDPLEVPEELPWSLDAPRKPL